MSGSFDRVRVLVIEDNQHMSKILRVILQGLGVRVIEEVRDAETAITTLHEFNPDIVVVDYMLQGEMTGLDFARYVRTDPDCPNKYLPLLMVTGHTDKSRVIEAINAGVNEYLAKPVRPIDMYNRMVSLIERPRRFVRVPGYFGPDRRRRQDPVFQGPWKRAQDEARIKAQKETKAKERVDQSDLDDEDAA